VSIGKRHSTWNRLLKEIKKLEQGRNHLNSLLHCHASFWFAKFDAIIS
jgi:hypothetical protein